MLLSAAACGASFDCGMARNPVEHAICDDPELSALDDSLADTYRAALKGQDADGEPLKSEQRRWLKSRPANPDALKRAYRVRMAELLAMPIFQNTDTSDEKAPPPVFHFTKISQQYDFELRMHGACPQKEDSCEGAANLLIYDKGQTQPRQTIKLGNVFVSFPDNDGKPLVNSAQLYEYQGVINVGDFNFDGHDDFGIQTGNYGSYDGPSYDIYLFNPKQGRFVYNVAMSNLIAETLGFFNVDAKNKRLHTFAKSGCCYHETTTYRV
ncbi:MAG: hypothetical protein LBG66_05205, partial [Gallionellaceae bacterium]|nr:hypothetical protein [Gallionellaceae bacterium]